MHSPNGPIELSLRVPADVRAPAVARRLLVTSVGGAIEPEVVEIGTLLVSELVTNSVRHAGIAPPQQVGLHVRAHRTLRVEVSDDGGGLRQTPAGARGDGGFGLVLLAELADRWGVDPGPPTCFWFEVDPRSGRDRGPGV